ncbi:MAG: hypothetical protein ACTFAL_15275 [Candidatus Electronema sp. V4]|uniref:hypothetical protein n=1 Tax=Candidatus Electronema sp. V4 TaxID=3454756 RepID=UPI0040557C4B
MSHAVSFNEILESTDRLSLEEQESLIDVIRRRSANRRRLEIASLVFSAREEFKAGWMRPENQG